MANWYTSREVVKRALGVSGSARDSEIDLYIEAASREFDRATSRRFIPITATRNYRWPQRDPRGSSVLYLDEDLLSVSALTDEGDDATAISSSDYFLEPNGYGPPYARIEIDLASTEAFGSKDTPQRAVRITGSWGYGNDTVTAGTLGSGLSSGTTATEFITKHAALVDVGDTLLIQSEQIFISERIFADLAVDQSSGATTASITDDTLTVGGAPTDAFAAGEILLLDSEEMRIISITSTTVVVVERAYNGTTLATHSSANVFINRTLSCVRGINGSIAATHADDLAMTRYRTPLDVRMAVTAKAVGDDAQGRSGWTGAIGSGAGTIEGGRRNLMRQWKDAVHHYGRRSVVAV